MACSGLMPQEFLQLSALAPSSRLVVQNKASQSFSSHLMYLLHPVFFAGYFFLKISSLKCSYFFCKVIPLITLFSIDFFTSDLTNFRFMEPKCSMPHWEGLSYNLCPEPIQPSSFYSTYFFNIFLILCSHLCLGLPKGIFPLHLPSKILKALLPFSRLHILAILIF